MFKTAHLQYFESIPSTCSGNLLQQDHLREQVLLQKVQKTLQKWTQSRESSCAMRCIQKQLDEKKCITVIRLTYAAHIPVKHPLPRCKSHKRPEVCDKNELAMVMGCDVLWAWTMLQTHAKCFNTQQQVLVIGTETGVTSAEHIASGENTHHLHLTPPHLLNNYKLRIMSSINNQERHSLPAS